MADSRNRTYSDVSEFVLSCFSESQSSLNWTSIPLALVFLLTIIANITLLVTIYIAPSLHHPMYYCLCFLVAVDLLLSFSITPRVLAILWFDEKSISSTACFSQTFLIFFCQAMESSVYQLMAYDRYIAICHPLHYSSIITSKLIAQAVTVSLASNMVLILPFPFLTANLHYCARTTVTHCFCDTVALLKLACGNTSLQYAYSLVVLVTLMCILTIGLAFSYSFIIRAVLRLASAESALKAFHTCSSHLTLIGAVYCVLIISGFSARMNTLIPQYGHILLAFVRYLTLPVLNPLVYGMQTQDIRQAIKKLYKKISI
ncbi:olfactory receptor 56A4-like [Ambystoma mexicanum]|uniref:olfactory receptor 56A4-like n=1 Tax=Ambystoma mexicanum TaxID=8296 RepID=UPI0037E81152